MNRVILVAGMVLAVVIYDFIRIVRPDSLNSHGIGHGKGRDMRRVLLLMIKPVEMLMR